MAKTYFRPQHNEITGLSRRTQQGGRREGLWKESQKHDLQSAIRQTTAQTQTIGQYGHARKWDIRKKPESNN